MGGDPTCVKFSIRGGSPASFQAPSGKGNLMLAGDSLLLSSLMNASASLRLHFARPLLLGGGYPYKINRICAITAL